MKLYVLLIFICLLVIFWTYALTHATYLPYSNKPIPLAPPDTIYNILKCKDRIQITNTDDSKLLISDECVLSVPNTLIYNKTPIDLCITEFDKNKKIYIYAPCK